MCLMPCLEPLVLLMVMIMMCGGGCLMLCLYLKYSLIVKKKRTVNKQKRRGKKIKSLNNNKPLFGSLHPHCSCGLLVAGMGQDIGGVRKEWCFDNLQINIAACYSLASGNNEESCSPKSTINQHWSCDLLRVGRNDLKKKKSANSTRSTPPLSIMIFVEKSYKQHPGLLFSYWPSPWYNVLHQQPR